MKKLLTTGILGTMLLLLSAHALAATVGGVKLEDKITLNKSALVLNGAGVRTKVFFDIYVGALYLTEKKNTAEQVLADKGPKRVELRVMRHLAASDFMDAFNKAVNANNTPEEYAPVAARLIRFGRSFREVGEVNKGSIITLDYLPDIDKMVLTVNNKEITRIEGADFYAALLKIWLGRNPVQDSLKKEMLGG